LVTGSHLDGAFGYTVDEIRSDGIPIGQEVPVDLDSDCASATARALSAIIGGVASRVENTRPHLLVAFGDRFEMLGAALASTICGVPVAHIGGGDVTEGALDDAYRHALTEVSHLHFPSTPESARRIIKVGVEPWRVQVVGELSLDNLTTTNWLSNDQLAVLLQLQPWVPPLIVTYHPVTLESDDACRQVDNLLAALSDVDLPLVITAANHDSGGRAINARLRKFAAARQQARFVESLGWRAYASLMRVASAMIGNSSSGIVEAPSFGLPVVNIGTRQKGRLRADNVRDVGYSVDDIRAGLAWALDPGCRARLVGVANPYGDGHAAARIVARLSVLPPQQVLLTKCYYDPSTL